MSASMLKRPMLLAALLSTAVQAQEHVHPDPAKQAREPAKQESAAPRTSVDHSGMDHSKMDHAAMGHAPPVRADDRPAPDHVPPPPPVHAMGDMSYAGMVEVMGMDDRARVGLFALDRLEYVEGGAKAWSAQAWYGGDSDKLWLRSEGRHADGGIEHADVELLWSHAIAPFWDRQLGVRRDFGRGPDRTWAAFGVQGLAPYWFELAATAYVGAAGRTALRVEADYELLLTQRLVLQPRLELNAYGKDDPEAGIGSGLSDAAFGLRLRYEIRREFAPYVGVEWTRLFSGSADLARADGHDVNDMQWVVGLRAWF
jgi:copper resistance protein B